MRIAVSSDHAAVAERLHLVAALQAAGHEVDDLGGPEGVAVDYPEPAAAVSHAVAEGRADRGVLLCGTGIGVCITANKVHGIRAATVHDEFTAEMARRHNNANVVCLGARLLAAAAITRIVERFLDTDFDGGRHATRVDKIMALEAPERAADA
ncbi:MAG: ribose 5-phosphate isomerase B [Planctomycetota bacterium]